MISLLIPHVPYSKEADEMLDTCVNSLSGYDELILVVNDGIGYGASFNRGLKYSKGDFIVCVSNDTRLVRGSIKDLCVDGVVTTPLVNGSQMQFGCFFCMPRSIYEKIGGFDERFRGAYYEDNDLLTRWQGAGIELRQIKEVEVLHTGGVTVKAIMNEGELVERNRQIYLDKWGRLP